MKRELTTTSLKRIRPVFVNVGENIKRYDQMRSLFSPDTARIFAEPLTAGAARDQITWYSDVAGRFRPLSSLSPDEQSRVLPAFNEQVNCLFRDLIRFVRNGSGQYDRTQYAALRRSVESALEVPSHDDILLFETDNGPRFVLINWGFTLDLDQAGHDLIRQMVPFGVTPVVLQATYRNGGQPAVNEPLSVRWDNSQERVTTDTGGRATLPQVPYLSELTVSQTDAGGQEANRQTVLVDERDPAAVYPVVLQRLAFPMPFRVVDQRGSRVPRYPVRLDYQHSVPIVSDENGLLTLTDTHYGDTVQCYDTKAPKIPLVQTHTFRRDQAEYPIPVVIPDPLAPVKKGFKYTGLLLLLLLLLLAGLVGYYYFVNNENVAMSQDDLQNATKDTFNEKAKCNDGRNGLDSQYAKALNLKQITTEYAMSKKGGVFRLDYYTDLAPDQIEVFDGAAKDLKPDIKPLFSFYGSTIREHNSGDMISESIKFKSEYVTVRVTGQSIWNYKVNCPN